MSALLTMTYLPLLLQPTQLFLVSVVCSFLGQKLWSVILFVNGNKVLVRLSIINNIGVELEGWVSGVGL